MGFGDAGRYGAYSNLGDQFNADARRWVGAFQVIDQLCQVFDRVNVMMRWGRNQSNARSRMPNPSDPGIDFMARQLPSFTRFGPLRHFDL